MRYLFLIGSLLSLNVFAFPAVNDFVRFEAMYGGEIVTMERQLIKHVEDTDSFVQYSRVLFRGAVVQESTYEIQRMWFYTPEKVQNVLSNCVRREGALGTEEIDGKLVPTCSFYNEDSQLVDKIGSVPFGQVRFQQYLEGEEFLDFHLVSFREGK